jgi:hypothetical protein
VRVLEMFGMHLKEDEPGRKHGYRILKAIIQDIKASTVLRQM